MFDREVQYGVDTRSRGGANAQALTMPFPEDANPEIYEGFGTEYDAMVGADHPATGGNPLTLLWIVIGMIVALFFVHRLSPALNEETFGINWLSFFQVGVLSVGFILLGKAIFGRWHVPGITSGFAAI